MKRISFIVLIISLFSSCSKVKSDTTCSNYVKGEIIVGIKNTASIEDVFSLFNTLNLKIDQMSGFYYTSPYSQDSLTSIISYLNTRPYINARNFSATAYIHYQTKEINVTSIFFDMNISNQRDWIRSRNYLNLVETKDVSKNILVKFAPGQEHNWLKRLEGYNIVEWVELNCIGQFQIYH